MRDEKTRASWRKSKREVNPVEATTFGESGRSRRRFLFRVSALATGGVALVALLIWLLQQGPDQDVPLIVVAITESSGRNDTDALFAPPNHYALEDVQLLQACFGKESDQQVVVASKRTGVLEVEHDSGTSRRSALVSSVADQVAKVTPGGVNGDLVAVCLTAQGIVDGEIPYLLVGNSRPEDPSTWIRVDDLLAAIVDTLQDESQRRVVLLLDANRAGVIWDWGKLDNSFTSACSKVAERVAGDRLAVIVSCGEGERSWWDPHHQQSLFVRAIAEALTGRSDRNEDEIITVGEIADYLDSRVASNAAAIWAARQRPQLLTDSRDWEFVRTPAPTELPVLEKMNSERKLSELRTTFNRLDELWERREKVADSPHPPLVTSPLAWGALDKRLARLDQLAFSGAGYELELAQMIDECTNLLSTMEQGPPASLDAVPEIRLLEYFHGPYQRTVEEELFLADWRDEPAADAKQFTEVFNDNTERRLTEILWPWLQDQPSLKGHLVSAERLLARKNVGTSSPTEFVESHLIRLLAAPDLEHVRNNDYAAAVLKSHRKSRDAYFPEDIRASFWTRSRASELSTQRMDLIDQLLSTADASAVPAALDRVTEQYEELQRTADRISEGYRLRDQLLHRVPRIAETLLSDIDAFETEESETKTVELVRRATDTAQCLRGVLRLVDAGEYPLDLIEKGEFDRRYANARSALSALEDRLDERAENAEKINAQDSRGLRRAFAMLNGSALDRDRRKGIRDRLFDTLPTFSGAEAGNSVAATSKADSSVDVSATASTAMSLLTISSHHPLNYWLQRSQQATCESGLAATDKSLTLQGSEIRNWLLQDPDYLSIRNSPEKRSADGEPLADVRSEVDDLETTLRCRL